MIDRWIWMAGVASVTTALCGCSSGTRGGIGPTAVGPAGATLSEQAITLVIPAGALDQQVQIAATPLDEASIAGLPVATAPGIDGTATLAAEVYALTPHGTRFAVPVEVRLSHSSQGNVVLRLDDPQDTSWELVNDATFADGAARFLVDGFSIYAVAAATRECQRAACNALPASVKCGRVEDGCGGEVDVQTDCGRPECSNGTSCGNDNTCSLSACMSTFDCANTTAECGSEVDNCGMAHDVVAECANIAGCGANGTCTNINLCGACTPYADCAEALAAADNSCHPATPDGCGGTMDCSAVCVQGKSCLYVDDSFDSNGSYWGCHLPCSTDGDCPTFVPECVDGDTVTVGGWWCEGGTHCAGIGGESDCTDSAGNPTACVNGACQ